VGEPLPAPASAKPYKSTFFKAERFVEKPFYERAVEYVSSGQYRWNAGMFIWSFVTLTQGLEKHQPEMAEACQRWFQVAATPAKLQRALARDYPGLKKISIDFALMEHAHNVVVADGTFAWDDLGSWTALARHLAPDPAGNCAVGELVQIDALRNIVFDARTKRRTPIAIVGLRDGIVVQTDDATLVAHRSQAQKVKELVHKLAADKKYRKLV
jgi:mannose-1-phosphate guanylyltransferase